MKKAILIATMLLALGHPAKADEPKVVCMTDAPNTEKMSVAERLSLIAYLVAHRPVMVERCSDIDKYDHMIVELTLSK
jgi:hypothetical protein